MLMKLVVALSVPIMLLNVVGVIIGGIWLAFLGEWKLIGVGIALSFISHWIISLLMMLSIPLATASVYLLERRSIFGYFVGFLAQFYTNALIVGSCIVAFTICAGFYSSPIGVGFIPFALWSWGIALGPWQFLASKEPDNEFSIISTFSASSLYFIFLVSAFSGSVFMLLSICLFAIVQLIALPIFTLYLAHQMQEA